MNNTVIGTLAVDGCYIWYSKEGPGRAAAPPSPLLAVPNVTVYPSTASVPITVLLNDGPLLCGFNVAVKLWHVYCVQEGDIEKKTDDEL